jgi:hypothetical protein
MLKTRTKLLTCWLKLWEVLSITSTESDLLSDSQESIETSGNNIFTGTDEFSGRRKSVLFTLSFIVLI